MSSNPPVLDPPPDQIVRVEAGRCSEHVQAVLDAFPFYVMLVDSEHTILAANQATRDALEVDPDQIIGHYCPTVVHGYDGPYPGCPLEKANATGGSVECEMRESEDKILMSGMFPTQMVTEDGNRIYVHTTRNITAQRKAEESLHRSYEIQSAINELLRLALEPLPLDQVLEQILDLIAGIPWLEFASEGAIFLADEATDTLELKAQRGMDEVTRTRCSRIPFGTCFCGRAASTRQVQLVAETERGLVHAMPAAPNHTPHGHYCVPIEQSDRVLGVLNVYLNEGHRRDPNELVFLRAVASVLAGVIQRNRAVERQLAHEHIAVSRERMARLGEIAAGVAHTVRNPLHGVQNCVDILEARLKSDDPEVVETLALMREGFERIDKVTRRLLSFTRDVTARPHGTSVADLLADVDRLMAGVATAKGVTLDCGPAPTSEFVLDADRVAEALFNVVGNAIDACQSGDRVEVRAIAISDGGLTIEVEDTGEGIPAASLARVLDPFFTTKPLGEGSGLGLAITRRVMEEHHGSVDIRSEEGVGTTVRLIFPPDPIGIEQEG